MERLFEFAQANGLCASFMQMLDINRQITAARIKDADKFRQEAKNVLESKVISSQIVTALQTENLNMELQPNEKSMLRAIYVCSEGEKILSTLRAKDHLQKDIIRDINTLSSMSSTIKWFFANKQAKEAANNAYQRLAEIMQGDYPKLVNDMKQASDRLDHLSVNEAYGLVAGKEQEYTACLGKWIPDLVKYRNLPIEIESKIREVNKFISQYQNAVKLQETKEQEARNMADQAIHPLIMEQTMMEMRKQEIDVLSQKRSGIRIKALRDHGYRNMADIQAASSYQLASVYGISVDSARQIKEASNEIAQEIAKTVKIKINSDDRTPAATALLKAAFKYDQIKKAVKAITPDVKKQLEDAVKDASYLETLNNNVCWTFSNEALKRRYIRSFRSVKNGLSPEIIRVIQNYNQVVQQNPYISDTWVWMDFSQRSIEYFNLLEDLCPGAFGNDDLLYGLPEDLAREIQDQTYFPDGLKVSLRRYQEWGVKYILHQGKVLLGDEMGLGKTVQAIATMVSLRNTGAKKFLVVCPASVLPNWCKEIDKKSEFHSIKIHGYGRQEAFESWNSKGGVAVTTYETLSTLTIPANMKYDLLIVDEAHFIKNENAQRSQYVRLYGTYTNRILYMTGTALENKVEEMISLLQVLNPKIAKQAQKIAFMSTAPQFRQMIAPVYYRRKREDVLTELPDITNTDEWCDLLPQEQEAYRRAVFAKDRSAIRKVSWVTPDLSQSAKARRLKEIVEEAESEGRKILVFSFYLETIDRVIELLGKRCTQPINGSVNVNRRQEIIDEFEKMPAGSVLPAQIQAGGTGLNIQAASVVVICEPQLKPSIENQAISRAYRMGQSRKVMVYRLLASDTIDERIDEMLSDKQAIFDAFADISEAASATQKEEQHIDDKTFGKLIQEEIDRINAQNGTSAPQQAVKEPELVNPHIETRKPETMPQRPMRSSSDAADQSSFQSRPASPPVARMNPTPSSTVSGTIENKDTAYRLRSVSPSSGVRSSWETSSVYKEKPTIQMPSDRGTSQNIPDIPVYRARPVTGTSPILHIETERKEPLRTATQTSSEAARFSQLEDFLTFVGGNGILVKDNRGKGGCVWVKADPKIDKIIKDQVFEDRKFKYSAKSRAMGGEPGWYY